MNTKTKEKAPKVSKKTTKKIGGSQKTAKKKAGSEKKKKWWLRLYVAGQTARSLAAFQNLQKICDEYMKDEYEIEVIDLLKNPHLAKGDQIVAIPTLVRNLPAPMKKIIGDLSNSDRVLVGLDIKEKE